MTISTDIQQLEKREVKEKLRDGWRMVKFGEVTSNVDINERDPLANGLERYVGLDHIDPESLHIKRWGMIEEGTSFTRKFVKGQVLFGKRRAYQRKVAVADFDGICSGDILVFEAKEDLLPELLPFIVQSEGFYEYALSTSAGSLSPRTKWKDIATYEFVLPPIDEQRRIADILWAMDDAIQKQEALVKILHVTVIVCSHSLTKTGIGTPSFRDDDSLGKVPAHWEVFLLSNLSQIRRGASPRPIDDKKWFGEGPGWVRISDVTSSKKYLRKTEQYLSDAGVAKSVRIAQGDVIMSICATVGRPIIVDMDACIHDGFVLFSNLNPKILPEFLYYRLLIEEENFARQGQPGTQKNLNTSIVGNMIIGLPPIEEQAKIVALLSKLDNTEDMAQSKLSGFLKMKRQLIQDLLLPE